MNEKQFRAAIEQRIADWLAQRLGEAATPEVGLMIERMQQLILRAGKRSRPRLLFLAYQAYGGQRAEELVDVGLALELQHQFLLVHDDIMDNDTVRYDGPNMLGYYRQDFPEKESDIADSMALMAGNVLYTYACQAILRHPTLSDAHKVALLTLLQETNLGVHAGQQLDIVNVLALAPEITKEKLLVTDYLKTSLYSVRLPMQAGAELAGAPNAERGKIDIFARNFGILYQLVDDYSDYFQNASSFDNHPKYRDFKQGKITYPLLAAFEHAGAEDAAFLRAEAGNKRLSDDEMQKITAILERSGAKAAAAEQIEQYHELALRALESLGISPADRRPFKHMLDSFRI